MEDIAKEIKELKLFVQSLEQRISDLENGEFGTGIYLEGCNDETIKYVTNSKNKKSE